MFTSIFNPTKMKNKIKWLPLGLLLLIIGTIWVGGLYFIFLRGTPLERIILVKEGIYRIGDVFVDVEKRQIKFNAYVAKTEGWVQHLIYLHGYKWLKEKSAIVSCARLRDLQQAIALINRWVWDDLWQRKGTNKASISVLVRWDNKKVLAQELVLAQDKLEIWDIIFLGTPYFDQIVLGNSLNVECQKCPFFSLEKKALEEIFIRESKESGYRLATKLFPPSGKELEIIIRFM